jgi:urate oxidase / 2-oxo-4-hydroxy-4-carboxy-5-ureidoimidazoline decarboxylase
VTTVAVLSALGREAFVERVGPLFEGSPWIAEEAWSRRPFETAEELHGVLVDVVESAPAERRLSLLRAHPDLAGRAAMADELTAASAAEQRGAGLTRLDPERYRRLAELNARYTERFGFPAIVCVRDFTVDEILVDLARRLHSTPEAEEAEAVRQVARIAWHRLGDEVGDAPGSAAGIDALRAGATLEIGYGKAGVAVYRHRAAPLVVASIPESPFTGRANELLAAVVTFRVAGSNFLPAYTRGDNRAVVATDSMKNFILRETLDFPGSTYEALGAYLATRFVDRYDLVEALTCTVTEIPFEPIGLRGGPSRVLHERRHGERTTVRVQVERSDGAPAVTSLRTERDGIELLKTTGSSWVNFVRDEYTTLPDRTDRPLFVRQDVAWTYGDLRDGLDTGRRGYVAAEQVRDVCATVFDELNSDSIQQLVYEMGLRVLARFPQLGSVEFVARNLTRDPVARSTGDEQVAVFSDPFPAFGTIELVLRRP